MKCINCRKEMEPKDDSPFQLCDTCRETEPGGMGGEMIDLFNEAAEMMGLSEEEE